MPNKAFLEITNACNLHCSFCHGTSRAVRYLTADEFTTAAARLRGFADYLYFHVMGEPLLHPLLGEFLSIAGGMGFRVILTTNGTLLARHADVLLAAPALHKVSISLHCYEANGLSCTLEDYLSDCFAFCRAAADAGIIAVMRLWNRGGEEKRNREILAAMHEAFPGEWKAIYSGAKLAERVFLEWGERFDWPDPEADYVGGAHGCYGLRDQVGVLCDGTVVPCCLDADGRIALGNLFRQPLEEILASPRAEALKRSFAARCVREPLCLHCGYAAKRR